MDQSPAQAAEQEQAKRQAAFERARLKLAAARGGEERKRGTMAFSPVFTALKFGLLYFVLTAFLVWTVWKDPSQLHPSTWAADYAVPLMLAILVCALVYGLFRLRRRLTMHPAERQVRDFYRGASSKHRIAGLEQSVVYSDFDTAPRRPPALHPQDDVLPCIAGPDELNWYWDNLLKPDGKRRFRAEVRSVKLLDLEPDLKLAQVKLKITRHPNENWMLYAIPFVSLGVFTMKDEFPWLADARWESLAFAVPLMLVSFAAWWWANRKPGTFRVRKLLVRCGDQWRLFCGDWEGWEEADLSWLDEQEPRAVCEANVV